MKNRVFISVFLVCLANSVLSQEIDLDVAYGRFYSPYKFVDYGSGFKNNHPGNRNFFPSVTLNKYYSKRKSLEVGMFFTLYEQYYGTNKYISAFESSYGAVHFVIKAGYSFIKNKSFESRIKAGLGVGIAPDLYQGEYVEMFIYPYVDSISRGNIKRDFTPIFPMLSTGLDFSHKISKRLKLSFAATYQKGFFKITEYDVYYNNGSGNNDQRAKQWGNGDFYGLQLGIRYIIVDENGNKLKNKKRK
jgi:hypothetical protein